MARSYVKKKKYKQSVQAKLWSGLCNNSQGGWVSGDNGCKTSFACSWSGSKCNKSEKDRRPYKGGRIRWSKVKSGERKKRDEQE